ncbi:LysR family transcriptional regulator [Paenibacillus sp. BC26]|uniref:LysR family transcriptional regulator n=1 Tax=Paenibacillus sp. BC26 TaxID=1881032 RepID=UPI0008F2C389|nr:LysR substrate-binding domain-containing protein [Paenibacillus sp. BC26]SFS74999.1 transcriptional regulator, LysR family [Paenibacillus sp. BC26]
MNLYGLIVFHHVAASGSVTRAAEILRISQPAVTAHVRNMAAELGLTLLAPKGRGILLTEAGARVAKHAAKLFALQNEISRDLELYRSGEAGELRIAATSLPANFLLPEQLVSFRAACPAVHVSMQTLNASDALGALQHYKADIAVIGGGGESRPGLERKLLQEDELWFVVAANHRYAGKRLAFAALMKEPFIMREPGSAARERLLSLCRVQGMSLPREALQVSGVHESLHAAAAGLGVSFVSSLEASRAVSRGELARVEVEGVELRNPIVLYTREGEAPPPAAQHFIQVILKQVEVLV